MNTETVETRFLGNYIGFGDVGIEAEVARVFGFLAEKAGPVVKHYHSDLYHDAQWLEKYLFGDSFTFYWAVREYGTHIGTIPFEGSIFAEAIKYKITVEAVDGKIMLEAERV